MHSSRTGWEGFSASRALDGQPAIVWRLSRILHPGKTRPGQRYKGRISGYVNYYHGLKPSDVMHTHAHTGGRVMLSRSSLILMGKLSTLPSPRDAPQLEIAPSFCFGIAHSVGCFRDISTQSSAAIGVNVPGLRKIRLTSLTS